MYNSSTSQQHKQIKVMVWIVFQKCVCFLSFSETQTHGGYIPSKLEANTSNQTLEQFILLQEYTILDSNVILSLRHKHIIFLTETDECGLLRVRPAPTPTILPSFTITQPTIGLGLVEPIALVASSTHLI